MNQIFVSLSLMHSIYFYYRFLINSKSKQAREVSYLAQAAIIKTGWLKQQTFNSQCYRGSPRLRCWQIRFLVRALFPLPGLRTSALPLHDGGREERMNRGKEGERKRKRDTQRDRDRENSLVFLPLLIITLNPSQGPHTHGIIET